jgi:hypothetical protein
MASFLLAVGSSEIEARVEIELQLSLVKAASSPLSLYTFSESHTETLDPHTLPMCSKAIQTILLSPCIYFVQHATGYTLFLNTMTILP